MGKRKAGQDTSEEDNEFQSAWDGIELWATRFTILQLFTDRAMRAYAVARVSVLRWAIRQASARKLF
jgi:hypothetical protein